jgi:hypothetical protein
MGLSKQNYFEKGGVEEQIGGHNRVEAYPKQCLECTQEISPVSDVVQKS